MRYGAIINQGEIPKKNYHRLTIIHPTIRIRLLTHNFLQCRVKNCNQNNFPLQIRGMKLEEVEAEYNEELIKRLLQRVDWIALREATLSVSNQRFSACDFRRLVTVFLFLENSSVYSVFRIKYQKRSIKIS